MSQVSNLDLYSEGLGDSILNDLAAVDWLQVPPEQKHSAFGRRSGTSTRLPMTLAFPIFWKAAYSKIIIWCGSRHSLFEPLMAITSGQSSTTLVAI